MTDGLGHLRRLGAVRARLADRQPARDAAVPGRGRADLDGARRRDGRASRERGRGAGARTASRRRSAASRRSSSREADPARVFGQVMRRGRARPGRGHGDASCATTLPARCTVLGGWSETGALLFPVGSAIELGSENSALVEVYRTGEARRVTYPEDAGTCSQPICARTATARAWPRRSSSPDGPLGRARRLLGRREPAARGLRAAPVRLRRPRGAGARERRRARQARRLPRAHRGRGRCRAPPAGAQPARRRAAAPRLARAAAATHAERAGAATRDGARRCSRRPRPSSRRALDELRELARGIHPAILTDRGLGPALEAILARAPAPRRAHRAPRGAAARARRGGRLLRRGRDHHEHREARPGRERDRQRHADGQRARAW